MTDYCKHASSGKNVNKCHALLLLEKVNSDHGQGIKSRKSKDKSRVSTIEQTPIAVVLQNFGLVSRQMVAVLLISLCIGVTSGFRGPHHPKSSVSHHHYVPQSNIKLTQDTELLHDATHLKEDMGPMGEQLDFSKMTAQEIEFHYFKVHDVDNNTKLDGLELLHAIQHSFHENRLADVEQGKRDIEGEDDLPWIVGLIDKVLKEDDLDNDGYLGYIEYVIGRQRDRVAQSKRKPKSRIEG
ncbi:hypothetical protein KM043_018245 [Ampulex compressa]|nr:hypothetical protein KM043_018245 [Ampulex compressa]